MLLALGLHGHRWRLLDGRVLDWLSGLDIALEATVAPAWAFGLSFFVHNRMALYDQLDIGPPWEVGIV